ncbi:ABC transporter permease [Bacillus sp. FJAT-52991]|uniref:ABC transporter permease n=1 Tax=Bacillus kandeliae TaxID=3129297 RepID=A0ABZ2N4X0_9BACI
MSKIWSICSFELLKVFQKPSSYLVMFGMPLLFTLLFGSVFSEEEQEKIKIAMVDEEQTTFSTALTDDLKENDLFTLEKVKRTTAKEQLQNNKISGILVIENGEVLFHHSPAFTSASTIEQIVNNAVSKINIQMLAAEKWSEHSGEDGQLMFDSLTAEKQTTSAVTVINAVSQKEQTFMTGMNQSSAGFSIMFVMIMMMSVTGTILEARTTGVWYRLLSTPTSRMQLMSGYLLAFFLIGWIQFAILMVSSSLLFDVHWGDMVGLIVLTSALLVCIIGLGLFIASLVKTIEQQSAIGTLVIVSTCMLGGVYWPLSLVPDFMQTIAQFVPQTWAMKGYTELIVNDGTIADIALPATVLLGFATMFLAVGVTRVKYE